MGSIYKQKNGKWRIRWTAAGERMSAVYTKQGEAARALRDHEREVEEIELGIRLPILVHKVFDELATYWLDYKAVHKRSRVPTTSMLLTKRSRLH